MTRSSIPNAGFTRSRNRLDTEGYGGVPFEQTHPFIAGLIGGGLIFGLSLWAMPAPSAPARSGGLRPEPCFTVSAVPAPAAIAEGGAR